MASKSLSFITRVRVFIFIIVLLHPMHPQTLSEAAVLNSQRTFFSRSLIFLNNSNFTMNFHDILFVNKSIFICFLNILFMQNYIKTIVIHHVYVVKQILHRRPIAIVHALRPFQRTSHLESLTLKKVIKISTCLEDVRASTR